MRQSLLELLLEDRWRLSALLLHERLVLSHLPVDFLAVVEVVREGRVDTRQRQVIFGGDLSGATAHLLVPGHDVLDSDAMAGDARLAEADVGGDLDVPVHY